MMPGGADGQYGSGCRETVKKFQSDSGLEIDGVVGKEHGIHYFQH